MRLYLFYAIIHLKVGDVVKKALILILILSILLLSACSEFKNEVLESLGEYKSKEYFTSGGFQDYTNYAKYTYENIDFSENVYFNKISSDSAEQLSSHIEDFEGWVQTIKETEPKNEVVLGYDFDSSVISEEDYLYIYDDPDYSELGCYDVYFFDIESMTLYYFHNNI